MSDPGTSAVRYLSVDTGGTFTDYVARDESGDVVEQGKIPSNREAPLEPFRRLINRLSFSPEWSLLHGTTVATNALLEDELGDVVLVTNRGLEGLLTIGRGQRENLYERTPGPDQLPFRDIPVVGVPYRQDETGDVLEKPDPAQRQELIEQLDSQDPEVVAVCLVHGYRFPEGEQFVESIINDRWPVVSSHKILPRFREYERAATTVVNAGLRGLTNRYLRELESLVEPTGELFVMGSRRGLRSPEDVRERPTISCLSGPCGGLQAAEELAGERSCLTLDMGGTSTDVAYLPDGTPTRDDHVIGGYPVSEPMIDLHTVGAGGGSVLSRDAGGHLTVGPQSAGADPGPACYGNGGPPTVTDVELALGHIPSNQPLDDKVQLDLAKARQSLESLLQDGQESDQFGLDAHRLVVTKLAEALREVSVRRGRSPEGEVLVAFGGAGGLFAAEVGRELSVGEVRVPRQAGLFSATGFEAADQVSTATMSPLEILEDNQATLPGLETMIQQEAPPDSEETNLRLRADCRFEGQSHQVTLPVDPEMTGQELKTTFLQTYRDRYGYVPDEYRIQLVNLDGIWVTPRDQPQLDPDSTGEDSMGVVDMASRRGRESAPAFKLENLSSPVDGPAILIGDTTTVFIPEEFQARPSARYVGLHEIEDESA